MGFWSEFRASLGAPGGGRGGGGKLASGGRLFRHVEHFEVSKRGSSLTTEVRGGCVAWMTMSYIVLVNPMVLMRAPTARGESLNLSALMAATALSASLGSLAVGLLGKAPFGLMPGMGLNAYFVFGICHHFNVSWGQALSCSFVKGAILLLLSFLGVCSWIVRMTLSEHLKNAITVAIGLFQALIGFQTMGLITASPARCCRWGT